ncbi:MAG: 2-amino-4-hydroxy-6-hydroxymethyldihydropteridine diphosphokinase [Calditerrivibrio sp.]|nr:2-amino-4-hydroxy-6-hydroxymethyldihydropteridine diphosphokinase [Calditerrivibrio sp.]
MDSFILGIGSNVGEKGKNIAIAVNEICKFYKILKISAIYKSQSLLKDQQDSYFNIVIKILSEDTPKIVFEKIKKIEKDMGRIYTGHWKERIIDIDIIDYNNQIYKDELVEIPHKFMHERSFVIIPLKEIDPVYCHPKLKKNISELIDEIKDDLGIIKIGGLHWQ